MSKIILKKEATHFEKLKIVAEALNLFFKDKHQSPYEIITRLTEELGEIATEVNIYEGNGIKAEKATPSKERLSSEINDLLQVVMQLIIHYELESEVSAALEKSLKIAVSKNLVEVEE